MHFCILFPFEFMKESENMSIRIATVTDFAAVKKITADTINAIYPHYYPRGTVEFFLNHHNDGNIMKDINDGKVFLLIDNEGYSVGTVTLDGNEIGRLFVLPEFQGRGHGRELLDFSENEILKTHDEIVLHASLPAKNIYLKRGFKIVESHVLDALYGDFLCYDMMKKNR